MKWEDNLEKFVSETKAGFSYIIAFPLSKHKSTTITQILDVVSKIAENYGLSHIKLGVVKDFAAFRKRHKSFPSRSIITFFAPSITDSLIQQLEKFKMNSPQTTFLILSEASSQKIMSI